MQLYKIADEIRAALDFVGEDGELTDEQIATLDRLKCDFADKVEGVCQFIRERQAISLACKAEAERLTRVAKSAERTADGLKAYLKFQMEKLGQTRVETDLFRVRVQRNSQPSVVCGVPIDSLGKPWTVEKTTVSINREVILLAAKVGADLPEGVRVETGTHLRID